MWTWLEFSSALVIILTCGTVDLAKPKQRRKDAATQTPNLKICVETQTKTARPLPPIVNKTGTQTDKRPPPPIPKKQLGKQPKPLPKPPRTMFTQLPTADYEMVRSLRFRKLRLRRKMIKEHRCGRGICKRVELPTIGEDQWMEWYEGVEGDEE